MPRNREKVVLGRLESVEPRPIASVTQAPQPGMTHRQQMEATWRRLRWRWEDEHSEQELAAKSFDELFEPIT